MSHFSNDIDAPKENDFSGVAWRKSLQCGSSACVEFAQIDDGNVAIRDSKNPDKAPLVYTAKEWVAFVDGVKNGEFDITITK